MKIKKFFSRKEKVLPDIKYRQAHLDQPSADDPTRLNVSISSEEPVSFERYNPESRQYEMWREVLDHGEDSVDLKRANTAAPILYNHDRNMVIGKIERAYIEDKKVRADIRLSEADHIKGYIQQIREGVLSNMSIGYRVNRYIEDKQTKTMRATDWDISEASIVGQPADLTVGLGRAEQGETKPDREDNPMPTITSPVEPESARSTPPTPPPVPPQPQPQVEVVQDNSEAIEAERERQRHIRSLCREFAVADDTTEKMVDEGYTKDKATETILGIVRERQSQPIVKNNMALGDQVPQAELERFSFGRLLAVIANPESRQVRDNASREIEICDEMTSQLRGAHLNVEGFPIPKEVFAYERVREMRRAQFLGQREAVATTTIAAPLIDTELMAMSYIDFLYAKAATVEMGANTLDGLVGNVSIPRRSKANTLQWVAEGAGADIDNSDDDLRADTGRFDSVTMTPKKATTAFGVNLLTSIQSTPSIESLTLSDFVAVMSLGIDKALLTGSGTAPVPQGIKGATNVNTLAASTYANSWANVVALRTAISEGNALMGSVGWIMSPNALGTLATTAKDAGSGLFVADLERMTCVGYRFTETTQLDEKELIFGNWADAMIGMWGAVMIKRDEATLAASGGTVFRAFCFTDTALRHPESFAYATTAA